VRPGEAVRLVARPDDVSLAESPDGALGATVSGAEFHGGFFMCGGSGPDGAELWFRAPRRLAPGENVALRFDPAKTLVFATAEEDRP